MSDGIDLARLVCLVNKEQSKSIKYITSVVTRPSGVPDPEEDDFSGSYIGEVTLKLQELDLSIIDDQKYTDEKDLNSKIINYLKDNAKITVAITKDEPLYVALTKAGDALYNYKNRDGVSVVICSPNFLSKHNMAPFGDIDIITVEGILPDDIAITNYINKVNTASISVVAYIDDIAKSFKIKDLDSYVTLIKES